MNKINFIGDSSNHTDDDDDDDDDTLKKKDSKTRMTLLNRPLNMSFLIIMIIKTIRVFSFC